MDVTDLRIALFTGNYNYVRDGANQALNRLVGYLIQCDVPVRVYSPVVAHPAFPATGDLVGVPAMPSRADRNTVPRLAFRGAFGAISRTFGRRCSTSRAPRSSVIVR